MFFHVLTCFPFPFCCLLIPVLETQIPFSQRKDMQIPVKIGKSQFPFYPFRFLFPGLSDKVIVLVSRKLGLKPPKEPFFYHGALVYLKLNLFYVHDVIFCLLIRIFFSLLILGGYRITAFYIFLSIRLSLSYNNFAGDILVSFVSNLVFRTLIDIRVRFVSDKIFPE